MNIEDLYDDDGENFDIEELFEFETLADEIISASNHRIHYGCHSIQIKPRTKNQEHINWYIPAGVQEINLNTSFNLDNLFELGQIDIYDQLEGIPIVEVDISKIFDGTPSVYSMTMCGGISGISYVNDKNLIELSNNQADFQLGIWSDQVSSTTGEANFWAYCSGMYVKGIEYNFDVNNLFTEKISLIGHAKIWNQDSPMEDLNTTTDPYWSDLGSQAFSAANRSFFSLEYPNTILPTGFGGINTSLSNIHIQNINISADFGRNSLLELGKFSPYHAEIDFPVEITTEISIIGTDGDYVQSSEYYNCQNKDKTPEFPIRLCVCSNGCSIAGPGKFILDLGQKNKLSSVEYSGGATDGDNVIITYQFKTYNYFKIVQSGSYDNHNLIDNLPRLTPLTYKINTNLSDDKFIQLPLDQLTYSIINWGDCTGQVVSGTPVSLPNHTYDKHGEYLITVYPQRQIISSSGSGLVYTTGMLGGGLLGSSNFVNLDSVTACYSFGNYSFPSLAYSFANLINLTTLPKICPSSVVNMEHMLENSIKFDSNISYWNTSNVTGMNSLFKNARSFNRDLYWDTSNVTTMRSMFDNAVKFNGNIDSFTVNKVKSFERMFYSASGFNQSVDGWTLEKAKTTRSMFENAVSFNQNVEWGPLGDPGQDPDDGTTCFETVEAMFKNASNFNSKIDLNMSICCNMGVDLTSMFENASKLTGKPKFNITTTRIKSANDMFSGASVFNPEKTSLTSLNNNTGQFTIQGIFKNAQAFSGDLPLSWQDSLTGTLDGSFYNAKLFNFSGLKDWKTHTITSMIETFLGATGFNQDISNWSIEGLNLGTVLKDFMLDVTLPVFDNIENKFIPSGYYTDLLINWYSGIPPSLTDQITNFGASRYFSRACEERTALTEPTGLYRWIISDGGMVPCEWYNAFGIPIGVSTDCVSFLSPPSGAVDCTPILTLSVTTTPTPTATPTLTNTNTPTVSSTVTMTATPTITKTTTSTPTTTQTITPTPTITSTTTNTNTPTNTPSYSSSQTPTATPTSSY